MSAILHSAWVWTLRVLAHLGLSLWVTVAGLVIALGPLLLSSLLLHLVSWRVEKRSVQLIGIKGYLALFGWVGTPVHELGHALMCLLFRHRIEEMRLFRPDPKTGTLGYVSHTYNPRSVYQQCGNLFIALGPMLLGGTLVALAAHFLCGVSLASLVAIHGPTHAPDSVSAAALAWAGQWWDTLAAALAGLTRVSDWRTWLFLYLALAVGSHAGLSPADLRSGLLGLGFLSALLFLAVLVAGLLTPIPLTAFAVPANLLAPVSAAIVIAAAVNLPVWILGETIGAAQALWHRGR
jgi:hypothetical protein